MSLRVFADNSTSGASLNLTTGEAIQAVMGAPATITGILQSGGSLASGHTYYYCMTYVDPQGNETTPSAAFSITTSGGMQKVMIEQQNGNLGQGSFVRVYRSDSAVFTSPSFLMQVPNSDQNDSVDVVIDDGTISLTSGAPPVSNTGELSYFGAPFGSTQYKTTMYAGRLNIAYNADGRAFISNTEYRDNNIGSSFALMAAYDGTFLNAAPGLSIHMTVGGGTNLNNPDIITITASSVLVGTAYTPAAATVFEVINGQAYFQNNVNAESINYIQNTNAGSAAIETLRFRNGSTDNLLIRGFGHGFSSSGWTQADGVSFEMSGIGSFVSINDHPLHFYVNSIEQFNISSSSVVCKQTLDLSSIAAGTAELKITATSDTPSTTYTSHVASTDPAGFIKITVGASSRYIPFYT